MNIEKNPFTVLAFLFGLLVFTAACNNQAPPKGEPKVKFNYQYTKLPIQLEAISPEARSYIKEAHETDTSSYLVNTRPVLFQIQGVGDGSNETRGTAMLHFPVEVMIYGFGELVGNELVDYGWIQNMLTGEIVWEMDLKKAQSAGGDERNKKFVENITLSPGRYELRYISNESHSNDGWKVAPPERPFYYGITVFNLKAIAGFKEILEKE